jgi:hypothetical protein
MKTRRLGVFLVSLLVCSVFLNYGFPVNAHAETSTDVFVGVDLAYGDVAEAKAQVDKVSSYTNFLVIGSSAITGNQTKLNETCQYAYDKGLSFISLTPNLGRANRTGWLEYAQRTWGERFLGFYAYDEPAGRQLDLNETRFGDIPPSSYIDAAAQFESNMSRQLNSVKRYLNSTNYQLFTSDYALYWFDYKSGYDVVFAEFGWNYSRQLNAALCRGAATVQNKEWGAIILWTFTVPPYIESGAELYNDLILAYDNGAKYILVFDSNADYTEGILTEEHMKALQQFWQYIKNNPRKSNPVNARTAYVLPNGYGYGFRGPHDSIWGLWAADALSYNISISVNSLLAEFGTKLDIIYDDGLQPGNNYGYSQLIHWDSYSPPPSPPPDTTQDTAPNLTPPPPQEPTISTEPQSTLSFPIEAVYAVVVASFFIEIVVIALFRRNRRQ